MRILLLLIAALPALADFGNFVNYTAGATQTGRPIEIHRTFAKDELCDYPRPYVDGVAVTQWQQNVTHRWPASSLCPSGSVRAAFIAYHQDVTNTTAYRVDFRNSTDACHLGNLATCEAAAYDQAGMLGRSWEATMEVAAWPASTTATTRTVNARTIMAAGKWSYLWLKGPLVTRALIEDRSTTRAYDFGWRETRAARLVGTLTSGGTTFAASVNWSTVTRPFKVEINYEIISVCYVAWDPVLQQSNMVVGVSNGANAGCASFSGRAQDGTTAYNHYAEGPRETVRLINSPIIYVSGVTSGSSTAITVNDASSINSVSLLKANFELVRVCDKSGNVLTVGVGAWGCVADSTGRAWMGTRVAGKVNDSDGGQFPKAIGLDNWSAITDAWTDADNDRYKSLHPVFVLTFWNSWAAVGIEYHLFDPWSDRLQDQYYDLTLKRSGGTTVASVAALMHKAMTGWKYPDGPIVGTYGANLGDRKVWDGTAPAALTWDYNLNYMRYSGVVPYDTSVTINSTAIGTLVGSTNRSTSIGTTWGWLNSDKGALQAGALWANDNTRNNCASVTKALGGEGGRSDIAPAPLWHGTALYAMSSALSGADTWPMGLYGVAACSGYIPYHIWEGNTNSSSKFCSATDTTYKSCTGANATVAAFGYPYSIDARPGACLTFDGCSDQAVADRLLYVGDQSYANWGMGDGNAHWPQQNFIPWVLSGDWYYERGMLDEGAWSLMVSNATVAGRKGSWGWPSSYNMSRTVSWFLRTMFLSAWAMPTGSPEEQYFTAKLQNFVAIEEGRYNIATGSYYQPCPGTMWCYGRETIMNSAPTTVNSIPGFGPVASWGWNDFGNTLPAYVYHIKSYWMDNFGVASASWGINLGYTFFQPLFNSTYYKDITNRVLISTYNPYTNGEYRDPYIPCRPQGVPQTPDCNGQTFGVGVQRFYDLQTTTEAEYADYMRAWNSTAASRTAFINDADEQGGYSTIFWSAAQGAGNVLTGNRSGYHAQEWLKFNMCCRNGKPTGTPMYTFDPTQDHVLRLSTYPSAGGNLVFVFNPPNGAACSYYLDTTPPTSSLTTGETSVSAGALARKVVLAGQSAGAKYLRVTCGDSARTPVVSFTQN